MSSYTGTAINPKTGLTEPAQFWDDFYGPHKHAVHFDSDHGTYPIDGIQVVADDESSIAETEDEEQPGIDIAAVLDAMCESIYEGNVASGWWDQKDNTLVVPTKIALIISECVEALEGHRRGLMDDKLTDERMIGVELADVLIRVFDLCGFLGINVGTLLAKKAAYNATRLDHKPENRAKVGGKRY